MEQSSESFEAFTRELLGVGDGAESALMATSASPAPFFGSPFLNLPAALAEDAPLFDFDMPVGDPQALKQPHETLQLPQPAVMQPVPAAAADAATLQPTDVLMAPFLDPVDTFMPQDEAGEPTDPPSAGSAPDGNAAASGTPTSMQLTVVREKNRIAQRKYRAKQRQRQNESSSKIAELTRKLAEMQRKQTELLNREKLFERFIATQTLKLQPQNGGLQVCEGTMSAFRPHTDIKGIADAALAAAAADQSSRDGTCEEIFPISKIWASHTTMKLAFGAGMTRMKLCNEKLTFTASGQRIELTREQVAHLSVGEYAALWKEIINGLAGCLLRAKDDMESASGKRLLELIVEARNLKKTLGFLRPETLAEYAKQTAEENGPVPQELWRTMAASLTLSPGQRENCVLLRNAAFKHLGALMRQRSELAKSMTTFATLPTAESCGVEANDYLGSASASAQLHSMLREENGFTAQLMMNLYGRILTPLQTAHVHVLAYPYECSALSLLDAIATGCGDSEVVTVSELLQQGAASAEQTLPPLCEVIARPTATEARAICCC